MVVVLVFIVLILLFFKYICGIDLASIILNILTFFFTLVKDLFIVLVFLLVVVIFLKLLMEYYEK